MIKVLAVFLVIIGIIGWFALGNPLMDVASVLWPNSPAPWENVTGYYYINKNDHTFLPKSEPADSIGECREWARTFAATNDDPELLTSDYECGVSCTDGKPSSSCRVVTK